jgi:membrane protein
MFRGQRLAWLSPFWQALRLWMRHDCVDLSAAFAYHGLQSIFPLCLIGLSAASAVLGRREALQERLLIVLAGLLPHQAMGIVESGLDRFVRQGVGAGLLGVLILALTASNAFLTLQRGADRIWWNRPWQPPPSRSWPHLFWRYLGLRLRGLFWLSLLGGLGVAGQVVARGRFSLLLAVPVAWLLLKVLPSRQLPWRAFWPGALVLGLSTSLLNRVLAAVLLPLGLRFQAYGVVGAVLLFTLWVWLVGVLIYYAQCLSLACWRPQLSVTSRMEPEPAER